jgi:myo-inositol-1(or 4)-monophosphatase
MDLDPALPLDWLRPTLDECRHLVRTGVREIRQKHNDRRAEIVTDLDFAVERALILAIRHHIPAAAIFSEETEHDPRVLDESGACFVIDPIDGTKELVAGRRDFAISLAHYRSGLPVAAVLDLPHYGERFECGAGQGTWHKGRRVEFRQAWRGLAGLRLAVPASQANNAQLESVWARLNGAELVPMPALAPKLATILRGECSVAVHLPMEEQETQLWDYAAASILLAEAGGVFVTWAGEDLVAARPLVHTGGWIAATSAQVADHVRTALDGGHAG